MIEVKAPKRISFSKYTVFLAGSIEMDTADRWQEKLVSKFSMYDNLQFLNPRRDDWDKNIKQSISDPKFSEQVNWELDGIETADVVVFYFDPKTMSPITLLELGYVIGSGQEAIICCPDGFWRKGNIEIMAQREHVTLVNTFNELCEELLQYLDTHYV